MSLFHMRRSDPETLRLMLEWRDAERRVRRGVRWLNQHAPRNWWRNLFDMSSNGRWRFRAKDTRDNECVLALAFETQEDHASTLYGYVTFMSVTNHRSMSRKFSESHGFTSQGHDNIRDSELLDAVWLQEVLRVANSPSHRIPIRYRNAIDHQFDEVFTIEPKRIGWWERIKDAFRTPTRA